MGIQTSKKNLEENNSRHSLYIKYYFNNYHKDTNKSGTNIKNQGNDIGGIIVDKFDSLGKDKLNQDHNEYNNQARFNIQYNLNIIYIFNFNVYNLQDIHLGIRFNINIVMDSNNLNINFYLYILSKEFDTNYTILY